MEGKGSSPFREIEREEDNQAPHTLMESMTACLYPINIIPVVSGLLLIKYFQLREGANGDKLIGSLQIIIGLITVPFVDLAMHFKWGALVYVNAAVVVVRAYVALLIINTNYISLAMFPIVMLVFIGKLYYEINVKNRISFAHINDKGEAKMVGSSSGSMKADNNGGHATNKKAGVKRAGGSGVKNISVGRKKLDERNSNKAGVSTKKSGHRYSNDKTMVAIQVIPYLILCMMGLFCCADDYFVVSHFLIFLSSSLGAMTLMIARLPAEAAQRLTLVLDLLHKTTLVVLLLTVHTVAAEYLGDEGTVVAVVPELLAVMLWFSIHFDNGGCHTSVEKVASLRNGVVILSIVLPAVSVYLGSTRGLDQKMLSSWLRKAFSTGYISGILPYLTAKAIHHWPGLSSVSSKGIVQLLRFWANISLTATTLLLVFMKGADSSGLVQDQAADRETAILNTEFLSHWMHRHTFLFI